MTGLIPQILATRLLPRHRFEADVKIVQEEDLIAWAQKPEVRELRPDTDKEEVRIEWSAVIP